MGCVAVLLVVVASGCIPAVQNRVSENAIVANRVVAMPPQVLVYTLDAGGGRSPEDGAERDIVDKALPEVNAAVTANGGHIVGREQFAACGSPCAQFFRWGGVASIEIGLQRAEIRNYRLHSVADWGFRRDMSPIRAALDADYALFVVLKQTRQTAGRIVLLGLGGGYTVGKQIDVACIADLRDGRMTWCATERDDKGDLADPGRVSSVVRKLLMGVFSRPASPSPSHAPGVNEE
jgi:hypothetical protein